MAKKRGRAAAPIASSSPDAYIARLQSANANIAAVSMVVADMRADKALKAPAVKAIAKAYYGSPGSSATQAYQLILRPANAAAATAAGIKAMAGRSAAAIALGVAMAGLITGRSSDAKAAPSSGVVPPGRAYLNDAAAQKAAAPASADSQPPGVAGRPPSAASADRISYTTLDGRAVTVTQAQADAYQQRRK